MSIVYADVESKAEQACQAFAAAQLTLAGGFAAVAVLTGKDSPDKALPLVILSAGEAVEDPPASGNYLVPLSVIIRSNAAVDTDGIDPKPADDLLVGTVFNAFLRDDLTTQLSAAIPDFTCQAAYEFHHSSGENGDCWENELKFSAYCCPSTLPA